MSSDGRERPDIVAPTVRLLERALRALGDAGHKDEACTIAAEGWALLREDRPRLAERLNGTLHYLTRDRFRQVAGAPRAPGGAEDVDVVGDSGPSGNRELDVRSFVPAKRHELILETFEGLEANAAFVLVNDHDPKPLYYQFAAEFQGRFAWENLESGPEVWRVRIGKTSA